MVETEGIPYESNGRCQGTILLALYVIQQGTSHISAHILFSSENMASSISPVLSSSMLLILSPSP